MIRQQYHSCPAYEKRTLTYATFSNGFQLFHILAGQECPAYRANSFLKAICELQKLFTNLLKGEFAK